jgi:hypothetical protein
MVARGPPVNERESTMKLFQKRCTQLGCTETAGYTRCQDCGKSFCADHISAIEFHGFREAGGHKISWTRFVCAGCAARATRDLAITDARWVREQATRGDKERASWIA